MNLISIQWKSTVSHKWQLQSHLLLCSTEKIKLYGFYKHEGLLNALLNQNQNKAEQLTLHCHGNIYQAIKFTKLYLLDALLTNLSVATLWSIPLVIALKVYLSFSKNKSACPRVWCLTRPALAAHLQSDLICREPVPTDANRLGVRNIESLESYSVAHTHRSGFVV